MMIVMMILMTASFMQCQSANNNNENYNADNNNSRQVRHFFAIELEDVGRIFSGVLSIRLE